MHGWCEVCVSAHAARVCCRNRWGHLSWGVGESDVIPTTGTLGKFDFYSHNDKPWKLMEIREDMKIYENQYVHTLTTYITTIR